MACKARQAVKRKLCGVDLKLNDYTTPEAAPPQMFEKNKTVLLTFYHLNVQYFAAILVL
jgi:hypothetical protein